jgi:hypothetical protein
LEDSGNGGLGDRRTTITGYFKGKSNLCVFIVEVVDYSLLLLVQIPYLYSTHPIIRPHNIWTIYLLCTRIHYLPIRLSFFTYQLRLYPHINHISITYLATSSSTYHPPTIHTSLTHYFHTIYISTL